MNSLLRLPISVGEGIDKLTILEIKNKYVNSEEKKYEIKKEIDEITPLLSNYLSQINFHYSQLYKTNEIIWDLCDKVRDKNVIPIEYSNLCVSIIEHNDNRFRIKNKINYICDSSLKEQKNYKSKKIVIVPHLGLGDMFTMVGAIRYLSIKYDQVITFAKSNNYGTVKKIFQDDITISVNEVVDDNHMIQQINKQYNNLDYEIIKCGCHSGKFYDPYGKFYDKFYENINLDKKIRFSHFHIYHDLVYEKAIYDNLVVKVNKYVFVHFKESNPFSDFFKNMDDNIYIYHPNKNYYPEGHKFHHVWDGYHNNIVNYTTIIENASEVYLVDSSFFCLTTYLNLKATKKVLHHTGKYNILDYIHEDEQKNWILIC